MELIGFIIIGIIVCGIFGKMRLDYLNRNNCVINGSNVQVLQTRDKVIITHTLPKITIHIKGKHNISVNDGIVTID